MTLEAGTMYKFQVLFFEQFQFSGISLLRKGPDDDTFSLFGAPDETCTVALSAFSAVCSFVYIFVVYTSFPFLPSHLNSFMVDPVGTTGYFHTLFSSFPKNYLSNNNMSLQTIIAEQ